mmetsp:Transcript_60023/g.97236  ORF Transcript_60023/g.97236 Transcript_60023/m.97236 type:complete len:114 (+) Transcript_60023:1023-1364(+)
MRRVTPKDCVYLATALRGQTVGSVLHSSGFGVDYCASSKEPSNMKGATVYLGNVIMAFMSRPRLRWCRMYGCHRGSVHAPRCSREQECGCVCESAQSRICGYKRESVRERERV